MKVIGKVVCLVIVMWLKMKIKQDISNKNLQHSHLNTQKREKRQSCGKIGCKL